GRVRAPVSFVEFCFLRACGHSHGPASPSVHGRASIRGERSDADIFDHLFRWVSTMKPNQTTGAGEHVRFAGKLRGVLRHRPGVAQSCVRPHHERHFFKDWRIARWRGVFFAFNASWPFASLKIQDAGSTLSSLGKRWIFPRTSIERLSKYAGLFSVGLRIEHSIADYLQF